ncbi:hypothetical protein D0N36_06745 [Hymenobacter lapidiphilus]|nr:hypothetical protein D0N36_06745 [Hymenobacter sp. CCM 8763]
MILKLSEAPASKILHSEQPANMDKPQDKPDKLLSLNKLSQKSRQKLLFDAFIDYPTGFGYSDRLHDMAIRANVKPPLMFQHARRHGFQQLLEQVLEEQRKDEAFAQALDSTNPQKEVPFSSLVKQVKSLSVLLLGTAQKVVQAAAYQIHYNGSLIARTVSEAGSWGLLNPEQLTRIEGYQTKLAAAAKSIEQYLKPGAIAQLLATVNFSQQIPDDAGEVDSAAFTVAALAFKMRELGLIDPAFANPDRAVAGYTSPEGLPEIDGWQPKPDNPRPQGPNQPTE